MFICLSKYTWQKLKDRLKQVHKSNANSSPIYVYTTMQSLGSASYVYFFFIYSFIFVFIYLFIIIFIWKSINTYFSKDAFNLSKVTVKALIMLQKISIWNKCCFVLLFKEPWKKMISFHNNIKQHSYS